MNIDAEIAKKLFGLSLHTYGGSRFFSTNEMHVVPILEALRKKGFSISIKYDTVNNKPNCSVIIHWVVSGQLGGTAAYVEDESLPLALCKAALLALEGK